MKKLKYVVILIMFFIPVMVKGDMAAPMTSYKVRISNPEGALTYDWNSEKQEYVLTGKKLEYDEQYNIQYEQIIDNELYGVAVVDKGDNYSEEVGYIKLSDTSPLEINIEDFKKDVSVKYYVFDSSCYLYKGPSKIYGKVEPEVFIKEGTIIESSYYDDMWIYVDYNGVKGWAYKYSYNIFKNKETAGMAYVIEDTNYNRKIYTMKDIELYKSPKTDEKNGKVIPKGTTLEYMYTYSLQPHSPNYYVSYNGVSGWIKVEVDENYTKSNIAYCSATTFEVNTEQGIDLYIEPDKNSEVVTKVPNGVELTSKYIMDGGPGSPAWYYVNYDGKAGWLFNNNDESIKYIAREENPIIEEIEPIEIEPTTGEQEKEEVKENANEMVIYYLLGALAICLTAIVILLLINKKNSEKKNKVVKEEPKKGKINEDLPIKNDK